MRLVVSWTSINDEHPNTNTHGWLYSDRRMTFQTVRLRSLLVPALIVAFASGSNLFMRTGELVSSNFKSLRQSVRHRQADSSMEGPHPDYTRTRMDMAAMNAVVLDE